MARRWAFEATLEEIAVPRLASVACATMLSGCAGSNATPPPKVPAPVALAVPPEAEARLPEPSPSPRGSEPRPPAEVTSLPADAGALAPPQAVPVDPPREPPIESALAEPCDAPRISEGCAPNYEPCLPLVEDVDCAGGGGNGPCYATGPVSVHDGDPYGLDRDDDGVGCE